MPTGENFELLDVDLPPLGEGQLRVRNLWLSVDPYMRGRMNDVKSYVPPFQLGEPMEGGAIGEVVESSADGFAPGDLVQHMAGWRDEAVVPARTARKLPAIGARPELFLGILGVTGATAYFGLLDAASAREGDIVFVSAAAGAVGSGVVQIAKAKGMTVIGSAGGEEKCAWVRSLGGEAVGGGGGGGGGVGGGGGKEKEKKTKHPPPPPPPPPPRSPTPPRHHHLIAQRFSCYCELRDLH
jgi:NADPH-dependent curcumin reductase CurA